MKYSQRILKTVDLMIPGDCLADIGCDHGYMSILAAEKNLFEKVYACDINNGPLSRAGTNIARSGLEEKISTVLSDGFADVPSDVTSSVICGMGGLLIRRILSVAFNRHLSFQQLILGPHSEVYELRCFILQETDYDIVRETAVFDSGKHYVLMDVRPKAVRNERSFYLTQEDLRLGTAVNQTDPDAYMEYLSYLLCKTEKALEMCGSGSKDKSLERAEQLRGMIRETEDHINRIKETV